MSHDDQAAMDDVLRTDVFWSTGNRGGPHKAGVHKGKVQFRSFPTLHQALDFVRHQTVELNLPKSYTVDTGERTFEGADLTRLLAASAT